MSPKQVIPVDNGPLSPIAERVEKVRSLTYEFSQDGIVIAVKAGLIVRKTSFDASSPLRRAPAKMAERVGTLGEIQGPATGVVRPQAASSVEGERGESGKQLDPDYEPDPSGPRSQLEIWRLRDPESRNSIDEPRRLRAFVEGEPVRMPDGGELLLSAISPNHAAILSQAAGGCPAAPPKPAPEPRGTFVEAPGREATAKVTILDRTRARCPDQLRRTPEPAGVRIG